MSTLKADTITATSNNGDLNLSGNGTGNVNLATGTELNGTALTSTFLAPGGSGSGSGLTDLNASNLGSGTVPDARFPATLPATSGVNLTALNATNLGSGTLPDARFPATLPAASGVNLTALNATNLGTGSVPDARLPANLQSFPAPGSDGNVLTAASGAWTSAAGGGGGTWELINSVVADGSTTITVTGMSATHAVYAISITNLQASSTGNLFQGNVGTASGIDTGSTNYAYDIVYTNSATAVHEFSGGSFRWSMGPVQGGTSIATGAHLSGMYFMQPRGGQLVISGTWAAVGLASGFANYQGGSMFGINKVPAAFDRFRLFFSSGNITSGRVTIWGIKHA
tara:strand:- start:1635 stop:2657 length:1023 start_codon:yes stop_codon:yes gene_type:complete